MRAVGIVLVASLLTACVSGPPTTLPEMVRQLARYRNPSDTQVAGITGTTKLKMNGPTRIPDVIVSGSYQYKLPSGEQVRETGFVFPRLCMRVYDFEPTLGKPVWPPSQVTDFAGFSYYWDFHNREGTSRVVLSGMKDLGGCAQDLWVGAKPIYNGDPDR